MAVIAFVMASLLLLVRVLFGALTSWWSSSHRTVVAGRRAPVSFGLPASLLLGGLVGIGFGAIAVLFAQTFARLDETYLQVFVPNVALFALVGALLLAALIQFASEVYFGWRPHRGELRLQPYKHKVDESFHRVGVTIGTVLTVVGLIAAVTLTATSIRYEELSGWLSLNVLVYLSILALAVGIGIYWLLMLVGWLLKGDLVIFLLIIFFVLIYSLKRLWRFLTGWIGGASSARSSDGSRPVPAAAVFGHSVPNEDVKESKERREYRDRKFLWLAVFFILFGMIFLLKWPPIGTGLLIAAAVSMLYYFVYYQNFIWLPVIFIILGLMLMFLLGSSPVGIVLLAAAAISILYSMTTRVAL